jgi:formamidopyrimidine-DNA glycosylase
MPELPEIETIKKGINQLVKGKQFSEVEIRDKKIAEFSEADFDSKIKDKTFLEARRRAKILILKTDGQFGLMVHLKMTGQLIFEDSTGQQEGGGHPDRAYSGKKLPHEFTRIIFSFGDGSKIYFNDIRRFGWIKIIDQNNLDGIEEINKLGPEPFSSEFTVKYLKDVFNRRSRSNVKNLLMDQTEIAGIGNIYANESLFKAGIDPRRKAGDINEEELKKIFVAIKNILKKAIELKGTSSNTYVDPRGEQGGYWEKLQVYGREGEKCRRDGCQGRVEKIEIGNRSTYFCSSCQS